ncbi:NAD(P)-binding domain-containing protein [Streptomyces flavidovirens]|uniref:NAD(P)-dependent oxidoreductase n=1 Tax=Streptomyces flavidovirens TaxID=67298 RepID=UPI00344A0335
MTSHNNPAPVAVLGLGAMGRALAGAFLDAGHPTTVWNRSEGKGEDLLARGAVLAPTAEAAVRSAELTVVCVVDYDASQAILEPLAEALAGRVLVNLTSDSPERARTAAVWADEHGIAYLDGAVMVPTPLVGGADALILFAGARPAFEKYETTLKALAGQAAYLGEDHALAAVYDLSMLDFFYASMSGLVHASPWHGRTTSPPRPSPRTSTASPRSFRPSRPVWRPRSTRATTTVSRPTWA